jgi:hypothetical protein
MPSRSSHVILWIVFRYHHTEGLNPTFPQKTLNGGFTASAMKYKEIVPF